MMAVPAFSAAAAPAEAGAAVAAALGAAGVVRLNGAFTASTAKELLDWVNHSLEGALQDTDQHELFGEEWQAQFGNVLSRTSRHDLKLTLDAPQVRAALRPLLGALQPAIADRLGEDALLYELAALISLPGAVRQRKHANLSPGRVHSVSAC